MQTPRPFRAPARRKALPATLAVLALALAGCAPTPSAASSPAAEQNLENPYGHVHGLAVDAESQRVLVASHHGLFEAGSGDPARIGPTIDLMGFAADAEGNFYASGHPGPGADLPNPVGLIRSTDGGKNWTTLSRAGESDFHALTVTGDRILGFDGKLRSTADGTTWETIDSGPRPYALTGSPDSTIVLATTEEGLWRSADSGKNWARPGNAPLLLATAFANAQHAVGAAPDGSVHVSLDAGRTWKPAGAAEGTPAAIAADIDSQGRLHVWVATNQGLQGSQDGGATFTTAFR